jgi:hypothetical protein
MTDTRECTICVMLLVNSEPSHNMHFFTTPR